MTKEEDERIKKDVIDELYWDTRVNASRVTVEVENGAVTLSGDVPDYSSRRASERDAWSIQGVLSVDNEVVVDEIFPGPEDDSIRSDIEDAAVKLAHVGKEFLDIKVEKGWVTLTGSVDSVWKKIRVEEFASLVTGVRGITNELTVAPTRKVQDHEIGEDIMQSLDRKANVDVNSVYVKVENGVVSLTGNVPSWHARLAVYETALHTVGVQHVRDDMVISPL